MENNKSKVCNHCGHANFSKLEFCSRCGKILNDGDSSNLSFWAVWLYHFIDAAFWLVDETFRWWEIGKLSIKMKDLRQSRAKLLKEFEDEDDTGGETSISKKQELIGVSEELSRCSGKEKLLRAQSWALTPEILFLLIFSIFAIGIFFLKPGRTLLPNAKPNYSNFGGQVAKAKDIFIQGQSVITSAIWKNNKLYIGGDGGLLVIDSRSAIATSVTSLPSNFFVRDLAINKNDIIVAGYSGLYKLSDNVCKPVYPDQNFKNKLINCIAISGKNKYLIGTISDGLIRGNDKSAVYVLGTQGFTINAFGRQGQDLWIMHEKGILIGRGNKFKPLILQILAGRHLKAMVTSEKNVFIGTDQGVVAGYKNYKSWVWTLVSAGKPGVINDLVLAGDILFIGSDDGLFRFIDGKIEQLSSIPCKAIALGRKYLAAVNTDSVMLFAFSGVRAGFSGYALSPTSPMIGSFSSGVSLISMTSIPKYSIGNLPDLNTANKTASETIENKNNKLTKSVNKKFSLPAELQKPIFSDLVKLDSTFYLATENRGVWIYEHGLWKPISNIPPNGVNKLVKKNKTCFAYGNGSGLFKITYDSASRVMKDDETKNLESVCAETDKSLILLYSDGRLIRTSENGSSAPISSIPSEFKANFNSVWVIDKKIIVISDKGVLARESDNQWNLVFFKGKITQSEVVSAKMNDSGNIFIALKDGRIFDYKNGKILLLGFINQQPTGINFSKRLWVAGKNSLFFYENNKFIPLLFNVDDAVLGAYPASDGKSVNVFTESGLRIIAGRSHN